MKKTMLIVGLTIGLAARAPGQGSINLASPGPPHYPAVDTDTPGNPYTGTFGIELWGLNAAAVPPGINLGPSPGSGVAAYSAMQADGFVLQATFAGVPMSSGRFGISTVTLPTIPGPEAVLALAVWNTSAPSWEAMLSGADLDTRAGVIAFVNPVTVFTPVNPPVPAQLTGWIEDLVMTEIPEPSVLTMAALGGALLLLVRRCEGSYNSIGAARNPKVDHKRLCRRSLGPLHGSLGEVPPGCDRTSAVSARGVQARYEVEGEPPMRIQAPRNERRRT